MRMEHKAVNQTQGRLVFGRSVPGAASGAR